MKLKVFILKKNQIIITAVILALVIIAAILLITFKSKDTARIIGTTKTFKDEDLDNDGKNDSIVFKANDKTSEYTVDIISNSGKNYSLEADPSIKSLGFYNKWWPMSLLIKDIDNDKTKEIILQSSDKNGPILHIFKYENGKYDRIASGRYSIFGTTKLPKDKSCLIILGSKNNDKLTLKYLVMNSGKPTAYIPETSLTMGKDTVSGILSYIDNKDVAAFKTNIDDKFASTITKGMFMDGSIEDIRYTNYSIPSELTYVIRTYSLKESEKVPTLYKIKLNLSKYDNTIPQYSVSNVNKVK